MDHFEQFSLALALGKKQEATVHLRCHIDSLVTIDQKTTWTHWYLDSKNPSGKIRHELYAEVIFPVLLYGYARRDPWAMLWLARTDANRQAQGVRKQADRTSTELLEELLSLHPDHAAAREELLAQRLRWFEYAQHEWPAGILWNTNGTNLAQCDELLNCVVATRKLDIDHRHHAFLDLFTARLRQYKTRLADPQRQQPE